MTVDLVVVNAHQSDYQQDLADRITAAVFTVGDSTFFDRPGGVFLRRRDLLRPEELLMLRATARAHIPCDGRSLGRVLATATVDESPEDDAERLEAETRAPERSDSRVARVVKQIGARLPDLLAPLAGTLSGGDSRPEPDAPSPTPENGFGGLTPDGQYEIRVGGDRLPPAPWSNVVANPLGGFVVTERGGGFTWAVNSYFYRLTPWHNDPVSDTVSEAIYLQDGETGELWCATPGPVRGDEPYTVRHGRGASFFEHRRSGIRTHLTVGMADAAPVKLSLIRVTNTDSRPRRLVLTTYVEWTLGVLREHTQHQVRTRFDAEHGAIFARNTYDPQFASWLAFHAMSEPVTAHTGSRHEFLGRNGTTAAPAALRPGGRLGDVTGAGIDPCAALQCVIELAPG
jgi:cyclic beta-1,2-glucan synthetase